MEEVIEVINEIRRIQETDPNFKERLTCYWKKLFLMEKGMKAKEKYNIATMCDKDMMRKRAFIEEFPPKRLPNSEIAKDLRKIIKEINENFYMQNLIYPSHDTYYLLCHKASTLISYGLYRLGYECMMFHTTDFDIHVPHFFVIVKCLEKGEWQNYLVDMTFQQFLVIPYFIPERIYHYEDHYVSPAYFDHLPFFLELAANGYMKINDEDLKIYLDGFKKAELSSQIKETTELARIRECKIKDSYSKTVKENMNIK